MENNFKLALGDPGARRETFGVYHRKSSTMSTSIGAGPLDIPNNLTIPQFFSGSHTSRPSFPNDSPCLIDEQNGQSLSFADVSTLLTGHPPH
jgi:hypothetical protein